MILSLIFNLLYNDLEGAHAVVCCGQHHPYHFLLIAEHVVKGIMICVRRGNRRNPLSVI
jgi:hypothetical protein